MTEAEFEALPTAIRERLEKLKFLPEEISRLDWARDPLDFLFVQRIDLEESRGRMDR